jgi:oligoendopeptidase F
MFSSLPKRIDDFMSWTWPQIEPYFRDLETRELSGSSIAQWLQDWSALAELVQETATRFHIRTTVDTTDEEGVKRFQAYLADVIEPVQTASQSLKQRLLASGLSVPNFEIALRNMQAEADLFREANVPLSTEEQKLSNEYDRIIGAQTVTWEGEERTLTQMKSVLHQDDRATRERAWRMMSERRLRDREALNALWRQFLPLRVNMARNAGYDDYRAYRWKEFKRFDYTPEDCRTFHDAIEEVVVPAATRIYERQCRKLGVDRLKPWDLDRDDVYPPSRPPLHPYKTVDELPGRAEAIFHRVDPQLGDYFSTMRREGLLDLDNRKGKAPGGYCTDLQASRRAFIFMNAIGLHDDVQTLLHEAGHAFHAFESLKLPYFQQREITMEIAEVASMSMELLAAPYLKAEAGGYYQKESDSARARIEHLQQLTLFWPYMAVVDAFQHWVYTHGDDAMIPEQCDAKWGELSSRFIRGVDWSGLDDARVTGWHRKAHIFELPFYYVDYGLAQIGAVQVWRNALRDQAKAVQMYRQALALGGTRPLPELFAAAGAKFAFDKQTLGELMELIEGTVDELAKDA